SPFFPTQNAFQDTLGGRSDAFVTQFDETGSLVYSSYLGGSTGFGGEAGYGITVDANDNAYLTGVTASPDFPLHNPYDSTFAGFNEAFIAKIGVHNDTINLIYDQVTMGGPPVFSDTPTTPQQILPQFLINTSEDTLYFRFAGASTDGTVGLRVTNTRVQGFQSPPINLGAQIFDPAGGEITPFNFPNIRAGNLGKQFGVSQNGNYLIKVFAESGSPGPFPASFQIHLAANVGLPRKLINGEPEVARGIRQDILFNHPAPRPQGLFGQNDGIAQTALFKFANPVEISQFANAVIVPRTASGFPLAEGIGRAPDPMQPLSKATPSARTPICTGQDPTGMVVDFTQIPDPAEPGVNAPSVAGTVCAVIGENDATSVTLPLANGVTSLILDMGSGQEIVDGAGADFMVFSPAGSYTVAVSNTPYAGTFVPVGGAVSETQSFDLASTNLTSARFVLVTAAPQVTLDAVKALNVFIDAIVQDPVTGSNIPVGDVGFSTITMRRAKASETAIDPFLELIAPDGSNFGKNESSFGDKTSQDLSDAALINTELTQSGFWRFFGRGYDQIPSNQSFGAFFVRLESGGDYDADDIIVSEKDEENTVVQKTGSISGPRERDSYLFQWHPGQPIKIVVNATSGGLDPVVELHDPEGFLIAANDNFAGRGRNAALALTLPANTFNAGAVSPELPDPSTYRLVVNAVDPMRGPNDKRELDMGTAYFRGTASGDYEVKVFTGALTGGGAIQPTVVSVAPNIAVQGATNLELSINGSNFVNGATVTFSGTGITVKTVNFISASEIKAVIDIAETAQAGRRDVIVNNPGGLSGTGTSMFEIRESLGTVSLQWEAPSSGETLAPPTNLALQFSEGQGAAKMNSTLSERPLRARRSFLTKNRTKLFNIRDGRVKKRGTTKNRLRGTKLLILQQPEELSNGTPVTRTVGEGEVQEFFINVPAEATKLKFETSNSTGDPDLFVRFGAPPDLVNGVFDFSSENIAPEEELIIVDQITAPSIQAGQWFVSVLGFAASTYTLTATYSQPEALSNGVPVTRPIQQDELQNFFIPVPADATSLTVTTSNSSGDPDLFVRFGSPPDLVNSIFDFSSETVGPGEESITVDQSTNPILQTGNWFVSVIEFESGQQTYTLTATHNGSGGGAQLLSYNVYRSMTSNARSTGTLLANTETGVTTFTDAVPNTGTFFYQVTAVYDQGESTPSNDASVLVTSVEDQHPDIIPVAFALKQNYPNPFNPETRIQYELPKSTHVQLEIFNLLGQKSRTLVDEQKPAGSYTVSWDGRLNNGEAAASGVYIYRLKTEQFEKSRKLLLLR
ncbi:MAG: T9SS type A sorting domain-containing protein, partial [bacterium]